MTEPTFTVKSYGPPTLLLVAEVADAEPMEAIDSFIPNLIEIVYRRAGGRWVVQTMKFLGPRNADHLLVPVEQAPQWALNFAEGNLPADW